MNILIDDAIYNLQSSGGISALWKALTPALKEALPDATFDASQPADVFLSTYYQPAPEGVPSVAIVYDWIASRYPLISRFSQDTLWKRAAIAQADAVIAISQWAADDTQRFAGKSATVAYPATHLTRAAYEDVQAFKAKYGLPDNYVLIVGRRGLYKNVETYWQALRQMPHLVTVCIGGEPLEPHANSLQLHLSQDELAAAYTGALCLVYPSLYEGFGLPVIEAYACGCAVICGDGGALKEINGAARVVNVTRPLEIAQALAMMLDPGARLGYILKGYTESKRFTWQAMAERVAAVIRNVTERETV